MIKQKKLFIITVFIGTFLIISLIIFLIIFSPVFPNNLLGNVLNKNNDNFITGKVLYDLKDNFSNTNKTHWTHMPINYKIENKNKCNEKLVKRIKLAFNKIQSETNHAVLFKEVTQKPDISIFCEPYNYKENSGLLGEKSKVNVIYGDSFFWVYETNKNLIHSAKIVFYGMGTICSTRYPVTEIHEILHTFGFEHSYKINSIMHPETSKNSNECKINSIDSEIIKTLKEIYSS